MANKNSGRKGSRSGSKPVIKDPRFASLHSDPRFARPKKDKFKVQLDERFKSIKEDKDFKQTASVDRYGRKIKGDKSEKEIERLYKLEGEKAESESESESEEEEFKGIEGEDDDEAESGGDDNEESEEESEESSSEEEETVFDPARGEGVIDTSDSEDTSDEESETELQPEVSEAAGIEPENVIPRGDETSRLAAVNLDWDNIRAVDLYVALSSFCPAGGRVLSVTIYPSQFGKERMAKEELEGPPSDIFAKNNSNTISATSSSSTAVEEEADASEDDIEYEFDDADNGDDDDDDNLITEDKGEEFDMVQLRKYQLERLRYYYAIIECDSVHTAKNIYDSCDGTEFEASANVYDLRYVPDETSFEEDEPADVCTKPPVNYEPREFVTDALQHSKVKLSWDAEDPNRRELIKKAFTSDALEDLDFSTYVASSDDDDDEEESESIRQKYRALLNGDDNEGNVFEDDFGKGSANGEMQVTFTPGIDDSNDKDSEDETTIEKYRRKATERKKRRKELRKQRIAEQAAENGEADKDLGFDDPFFNDENSKSGKTKGKKDKKKGKPSATEDDNTAASREELEKLVREDEEADGKKHDHFDMKSIIKAEKGKKNKKMKKKLKNLEGLQENFNVDLSDPRFSALYTSHHFAIDPTNPHFKRTTVTETILSETLKRREHEHEKPTEGRVELKQKRRRVAEKDKSQELDRLVASVKNKKK
ncbi:pre-rRNA processing protein Esf1 [Schizosaccharomyces japonicus yFS275]|uniref:Pre-rRNA processing protein Esf1 n=1 Tax=Schizosaccharomyces japonicus (strain yFS275 / FY16936) TaxID=402676 RepID=B6JWN6_SCHJY|nr:pre-rRNA processing protein Esf1 [Schizosaccharomyces japonicus yFS275]EEB05787.1 pre-rRNA processing protein Esf1 [Schizosaccharomyces japonicus yFS275]